MISDGSITKRLTTAVLSMQFVAAVVLIGTLGSHMRNVQLTAFRNSLRANANALFGAVQEADTRDGSIVLDRHGLSLPAKAVYSVYDSSGRVLGSQGIVPEVPPGSRIFAEEQIHGEPFLFYEFTGDRAIDPGRPIAVTHHVRVVFGLPAGRVRHEITKAFGYFTVTTIALLGTTAFLLTWMIRKLLDPIRQLAAAAGNIKMNSPTFHAPQSSKELTELQPLAAAIETAVGRLQLSLGQQRRFTNDAAHELKTDLAIIKSSLQVLSMKRRTIDEYEAGLALSLNDIDRLESTVQKMLTLARLEQALQERQQSTDLREAILDAIAHSEPLAEQKQIKINFVLPDRALPVPVGREDALLLCSNVLVNALQHSPKNTPVHVSVVAETSCVLLRIKDYGSGVDDEDLPFLFEAFFRGDSSRSRKTGGTGLGLSICKAICVRASGIISISNHDSGGALVEIRLPLRGMEDSKRTGNAP